jgi:quercetin dioxygenase-like cupin family protein
MPLRRAMVVAAVLLIGCLALAQTKGPNLGATALQSPPLSKKIVLVGGAAGDAPSAITLLAAWLKASPTFADCDVLAYPAGWPADVAVLEHASVLVLYNEPAGDDAAARKTVEAGARVVALGDAVKLPSASRFPGAQHLDDAVRQPIVDAIASAAGLTVPSGGVPLPPPIVGKAVVAKKESNKVTVMPWGELRWLTSAELGNSRTMTTGMATLKPGATNPRHFHPNCDEILHVIRGKIRHTMNGESVEMSAGDTVSIPSGVLHNATNIGNEDAVLAISFSSAYRQAVGY